MENGLWKAAAAFALALTVSVGCSGMPVIGLNEANPYKAEAKGKKDKKKPVIKFSGKSKITVEKGESVKIPKTTAKDNKDGNVTNKIKVTVKMGKKSFSKIAKAVKNNKETKFTSIGTYKITYTVADKAGNKASKTRTIKVVNPKEKIPTTTEKITTETPTTEATTEKEYPIYEYNITFTSDDIADKIYKVDCDVTEKDCYVANYLITGCSKINLSIENDIFEFYMFSGSDIFKNTEYLKYLGKVEAFDEYGNDISNNILFYISHDALLNPNTLASEGSIYIYVEDLYGNAVYKRIWVTLLDKASSVELEDFKNSNAKLVDKKNNVYAIKTDELQNKNERQLSLTPNN